MKSKQAVLNDINHNLECLRNMVPLTLEGQDHRLKLLDHLEEMEIFIHSLTEKKALAYLKTLEEYDQHFGHRREATDMMHILNRVLKGDDINLVQEELDFSR